ncbi:HAMP domain-containing sensor histidine kinase [Rhizosphaericola mali]|uniref:histidine kinase n=1 Tax=Rhizosphaericola mali TaxID=2545455 RepID=A0A5P2G2M2_9BACT|nr:sensor histidine kinase [Rhizosphaericola mali]QES90046.1 HAMP domain-containing protein [Rhizosphaericola mali]
MKIRNKIALLLLAASTIVIISLALFVYFFASRDTTKELDQQLSYRIHLLHRTFSDPKNAKQYLNEGKLYKEQSFFIPVNNDSLIFQKYQWTETTLKNILNNGHAVWEKDDYIYQGELYHWNGKNYIIVVGSADELQKEYLSNLETILLVGLGIAFLFLVIMTIIFSRKIFTPVKNITRQVQKIGSGNLNMRLPRSSGEDEIKELTDTFNEMLDRMETSFEAQKNFVSQASHEFNTPLTTIIGEAEFALLKDRSSDQYVNALHIILQQAERLKDLTQNLLGLARAQYVNQQILMSEINLRDLLLEIKEVQEKLSHQFKIQLEFVGQLKSENSMNVMGNKGLLQLAFSNIIVNAIKYSNYQPIYIKVEILDKTIEVHFVDKGVGIPEQDIAKIFDPYFRASNAQNLPGFGIGLPLSNSIIKMHHGAIKVQSLVSIGTEVIVSLPMMN